MSAVTARMPLSSLQVLPERGRPTRTTAGIRAVPPAARTRTKPKLAYAIVVVSGVFAIVVTQLLLSVGISQGAYEISSLQSAQRDLSWQKQAASEDLASISSPQYIAANAQALGMVVNGTPAYLKLSDSSIVGVPAAASSTGLQLGSPELVENSLIGGVPLVTAPDQKLGVTEEPGSGASSEGATPTPISLENGLPSPNTR